MSDTERLIDALSALHRVQRVMSEALDVLDSTDRCDDEEVSTELLKAAGHLRKAGVAAYTAQERLARAGRIASGWKE